MNKYTVTFHVEGAWEVDYSMTVEASNDEEAIAKVQKAMNHRAYNITTTRITP